MRHAEVVTGNDLRIGDTVFLAGKRGIWGWFMVVTEELETARDWRGTPPEGADVGRLFRAGTPGWRLTYEDPPDRDEPTVIYVPEVHDAEWELRRVPEHHPRCNSCGMHWPCRHESLRVRKIRDEVDSAQACAHCGKTTSGKKRERITRPEREWYIHTRKGPCETAYRRYTRNGTLPRTLAAEEAAAAEAPQMPAPGERPALRLVREDGA